MKKCCILYNEPLPGALEDELDILDQVDYVEEHLVKMGLEVYRKGITDMFMTEIDSLISEKPDFVFNLVEAIRNKGELNYFVPALLNLYRIPYSGNPLEAIFNTTSKIITTTILEGGGILSPAIYKPSELSLLKPGNRYILKPVWEDGSMGITAGSVFYCAPGFEETVAGKDDNHWMIQDFIEGREFNISVLAGQDGPEVLPPAEIVFRDFPESMPKIVDFRAKWMMDSFEYKNTVRQFPAAELPPGFVERMTGIVVKCWHLFGLKGYARVDVRADNKGNIFVIEINANPCISPDGGFVAATRQAGFSFSEVLERIINDLNG
jgi:D-alanine-D-alanine ligase